MINIDKFRKMKKYKCMRRGLSLVASAMLATTTNIYSVTNNFLYDDYNYNTELYQDIDYSTIEENLKMQNSKFWCIYDSSKIDSIVKSKQYEVKLKESFYDESLNYSVIDSSGKETNGIIFYDSRNIDIRKSSNKNIVNRKHVANHNYEIAIYGNDHFNDKYYYDMYYQIIDNTGSVINDDRYYGSIIELNDYLTLLEKRNNDNSPDTINENKYVILNHNTGEIKEIKCWQLKVIDKYLIISFASSDLTPYYQLCYMDGRLTSDTKYDNFTFDSYNHKLFLAKDNVTQMIDLQTNKELRIEGNVIDATNNFLIISKDGQDGLYYFKDNSSLEKKFVNKNGNITFINKNNSSPICEVSTYDSNGQRKVALYSSSGEKLSKYYNYINNPLKIDGYNKALRNSNYIKTNTVVYKNDEINNVIELISNTGLDAVNFFNQQQVIMNSKVVDILSKTGARTDIYNNIDIMNLNCMLLNKHDVHFKIIGDNLLMISKMKYDEDYGLNLTGYRLMLGNKISDNQEDSMTDVYNRVMIYKYVNNEINNTYIIGYDKTNNTTVIYDEQLNQVLSGNFDVDEAIDELKNEISAKILVKK